MGGSLKTVSILIVTLLILSLVSDVKVMQKNKHLLKNALDVSTKAAALQVDMTPSKIALGIFDIDTVKSKVVFNEYMKDNLGNSIEQYITDVQVVNARSTQIYTNPKGKKYTIDSPTIFASAEYSFNGIFLKGTLKVDALSGSQLKNKNDLKN